VKTEILFGLNSPNQSKHMYLCTRKSPGG